MSFSGMLPTKHFAFTLQHRHHNIEVDEAVVKVEGTAHVMSKEEIRETESFGNKVVPTTWMSAKGSVLPMDFAVVPARSVLLITRHA